MFKFIRYLFLWVFVSASFFSCGIRSETVPNRLVNDEARVLSPDELNKLETKLVDFSNINGIQIAILTRNGVKEDLRQYCSNIINTWGIGQAHRNNGLLLFIDPIVRSTFLATGTGTQVWLPDTLAKRIVDNQLIPAFKLGDYYKGIDEATDLIMDLAEIAYPNGK